MNRARTLVALLCVSCAVATGAGLKWFFERLIPDDAPARVGYAVEPAFGNAEEIASVQKRWPQGLETAGEQSHFSRFLGAMKASPAPGPIAKVEVEPQGAPENLAALIAEASLSLGETKARACRICHDFTRGGRDRIGPNLWGVLGRPVASRPGYRYSSAMASLGGSWTNERMYEFLGAPLRSVPGTKMKFAGIGRAEERAAVIRYLSTLGSGAQP